MAKMGGGMDLGEEAVRADHDGQIAIQDFDRDLAPVPDVVGEIHSRHSPDTDHAFDSVAGQESRRERGRDVVHARILLKRQGLSFAMILRHGWRARLHNQGTGPSEYVGARTSPPPV